MCVLATLPSFAQSEQAVRLGLLQHGTVKWEVEVIRSRGLDKKYGISLVSRDLANTQAGKVALMADEVDVILSDFVWVAAQRSVGVQITQVPHSLAVGGLLTQPDSGISGIEDLVGRKIAVAGGPLDKSWIIVQAAYKQQTGDDLLDLVTVRYGAPPLIRELLQSGQVDAALNFWHFNARSKAVGMVEVVSIATLLADLGVEQQPPLLGWVFSEEFATSYPQAIEGFLAASYDAKEILRADGEIWDELRPLMRASDDDEMFSQLRADYRAGIPNGYNSGIVDAAARSFALMQHYGGPDLTGKSPEMDPLTFWPGFER